MTKTLAIALAALLAACSSAPPAPQWQASAHDVRTGHEVAYVLCGGDGPPRTVTEQDILDLERESILKLLGTRETQERVASMLKTGKPVRN